jgi:tetratricopeptide (TPR) repeat protein
MTALNNLGRAYENLGRLTESHDVFRRAIKLDGAAAVIFTNLIYGLLEQPDLAGADSVLILFAERFPGSPEVLQWTSNAAAARRDWAATSQAAQGLLEARPAMQVFAHDRLAAIAQVHGRLNEAARQRDEGVQITVQRQGLASGERDVLMSLHRAERAAWLGSDPARAAGELERLWRINQTFVASRDPIARRYPVFVPALAVARRPATARRLLEQFRASFSEGERTEYSPLLRFLEGDVLVAEGRPLEAVPLYQAVRKEACPGCLLTRLGRAYDQAGVTDSALAYYQRYVETPPVRMGPPTMAALEDDVWLGPTYRRLGELYEQRGDREKALDYYGRFVDLWKDADPDLQPLVRDAKDRMARLAGEGGPR